MREHLIAMGWAILALPVAWYILIILWSIGG